MLPALPGVRRAVARGAVIAFVAALLASCGSSGHGKKTPARSSSPSTLVATRWWSNTAATVGSKIDTKHPDSVAMDLQPSKTDYCGMLKQTVAAGKSILPDTTSTDPALLISAKAFIAEIEKVAPASVTDQWQLIGPAVLSLVKSGGDTGALPSVDLGSLTKAANAVAADSLAECGVDLSSVTGLLPQK